MGAAGAAIGAQAAGGAYGIFQATQEGKILSDNAEISESNIPYVRGHASEIARQLQVQSYLVTGAQKASYAGRGLATGGSLFDIMSDTVTNYNRDASFALLEGELHVRGLQREADMARYRKKTILRDAIVGGVLNTGSMVARAQMPGFGGYTSNPYAPITTSQRPGPG